MTDLIIGMASGYSWVDLEPFAVSLQRSGYSGRCILLGGEGPQDGVPRFGTVTTPDSDLYESLTSYGVELKNIGEFREHPSIARSKFVMQILDDLQDIRFVLCTDTKDVVFQRNPISWIEQNIGSNELVAVSEEQLYGQGEMIGNMKNMIEAFGYREYLNHQSYEVLNGGIFGGRPNVVRSLCAGIYGLSTMDFRRQKFTPSYKDMLPDQSALNILIRHEVFGSKTLVARPENAFAFGYSLKDKSIFQNGIMYPKNSNAPYAIFHQYFCEAEWWRAVREKYRA